MNNYIPVLYEDKSHTPFVFYSDFLKKIAAFYKENKTNELKITLINDDNIDYLNNKYYIDPITLPLLLSLFQQLKNYHNNPIELSLSNTPNSIAVLEYLYRSDFFNIAGNQKEQFFPLGKNILKFNDIYLGGFKGKLIRTDHKLRCYSLQDEELNNLKDDDSSTRDYLIEHYSIKVREHFYDLLFENETTHHLTNEFVEILSELITNGVLHSKSDAFVLMFSDKYKTKFSISDNGIGLFESLKNKNETIDFYTKFEVFNAILKSFPIKSDLAIKSSVSILFETLYYSMLKDRQGLFDLMCNVVLKCSGYFRLHSENAQIIVSARMLNELKQLYNTRKEILKLHNLNLFGLVKSEEFKHKMNSFKEESKNQILTLSNSILSKYSEDTRFSAVRIFEIRFKGVHIEVEIPNSIEKL